MNFVRANEDMMWHSRYACSHVIMCVVVLNDFFTICESKTFTKLKALTKISATTFCYCKETLQLQLTN